jgi:hypothetical protein
MPKIDLAKHFTNPKWDQWKRFHVVNARYNMTLFDTGEVIVNGYGSYDPAQRNQTMNWGMRFMSPHDNDPLLKRFYADKDHTMPVRKTWLSNSLYMSDEETGQVVVIGDTVHRSNPVPGAPEWFMRTAFRAYCGGNGCEWLSPTMCSYTQPVKLTREQKQHLDHLKKTCMTADRMDALPKNIWQVPETEEDVARRGSVTGHGVDRSAFLDRSYEQLTLREKTYIARYDWAPAVEEHAVPCFWIGEKEGF